MRGKAGVTRDRQVLLFTLFPLFGPANRRQESLAPGGVQCRQRSPPRTHVRRLLLHCRWYVGIGGLTGDSPATAPRRSVLGGSGRRPHRPDEPGSGSAPKPDLACSGREESDSGRKINEFGSKGRVYLLGCRSIVVSEPMSIQVWCRFFLSEVSTLSSLGPLKVSSVYLRLLELMGNKLSCYVPRLH
ncbi:predicted protein [Chaetomium globosum CBS 148.51]|uniref:Uncharacterized protein n=1 Tax=Chaetomium globosum (strain ATCC 6205 / CBS 148.51 / DSM 1962 / NBRC 6347 / NRRL 1970) TaxID=306901 RepID=Q2H0V2_CHAGB|nr:uncharacterized protein CHGG_04594 [Chaetomium globosum CBS 148.51]EAQ87975.1 predicted protein [Chaetomium globosum CBS 148.51]